jgi:Tfp pilus assembly protein PilN
MRPINLLPPEAFQRQKSRQLLSRIAILGAAYLLLLVLLTILWSGRVGRAQDALDSQEVENAALQAQIVELQPVGVLVTQYEEDAALIESALAIDISWGRVLNDLGRVIPDRVWLDGFAGSASPDEETGAVGLMQTSGTGFDYPDVSSWLRALDSDRFPAVGGTWVGTVGDTMIGNALVVQFTSSSSLTQAAQSSRVNERIPEVGG